MWFVCSRTLDPPLDLVVDVVREGNIGDGTFSSHVSHDGSEVRSCRRERGITAVEIGGCDRANILTVGVGLDLRDLSGVTAT